MKNNYKSLFDINFLLDNSYITLGEFEELQNSQANVLIETSNNKINSTMISTEYLDYLTESKEM